MSFAAIFVPNFIFQAQVRCEPALGMQAVAVIDGPPPVFRVIACNRLAEHRGASVGMTKANAEQFQPMELRNRSRAQEHATHGALLDAAWSISSRVEDVAADTLLLDIAGLARLFGAQKEIGQRIMARTSELGLEVNVAISANVETAQIVARALDGLTVVPEGQERRFLETLPVGMLRPSPQFADILERWGVTNCKSLSSLPVLALSERAGQEGVHLHALASGGGNRPLLILQATDRFEEWFELEDAVDNLEPLSFLLGRLLQQLCLRITARALAVRAVHVTFQLQPAFESTVFAASPNSAASRSAKAFSCSMELPVPSQDPTLLLKLLRLRLQGNAPGAPVKNIHMVAEPARSRAIQSGLFVPDSPDPQKLELTLARIAAVVGEGNVGSPELLDTHRPDAFRMDKFLAMPPSTIHHQEQTAARTGFRVFRPPLPAWVQSHGRVPRRVAFQGMLGTVLRASGPWRSSGDWWENQSWQEDAWDVEIHFASETPPLQGLYRISYDSRAEKWRVHGVYD